MALERYAMERGFRYLLYHPFDVYPNGEHPDMLLPKEFNRQEDREKYGFHDSVDYYYSSGEGGVMEERIKKSIGCPRQGSRSKSISGYVGFDGIISNRLF
ncbi:MAG: hypothetical protein CM1200mP3_14930 [Chloroflexota bacterium]|nr:MAG: hypothetical protein CM1200mP3_14930 [Chloroflexota bacterium]